MFEIIAPCIYLYTHRANIYVSDLNYYNSYKQLCIVFVCVCVYACVKFYLLSASNHTALKLEVFNVYILFFCNCFGKKFVFKILNKNLIIYFSFILQSNFFIFKHGYIHKILIHKILIIIEL